MTEFTPTHLGKTSPIETDPSKVKLDLIPNPHFGYPYVARFSIPEFQSLCPVTGQPDVATIIVDYIPHKYLVESKSLKLYMFAFRNHGSFHEDVTMTIGTRLYEELDPIWFRIASFFNARGGISIDVVWQAGDLEQGDRARPLALDIRPYHSRI